MKEHGIVYTVIFTFVVCFVFVFVLALTNNATALQVQTNEILTEQRAVLRAMQVPFSSTEEIQQRFQDVQVDEYNNQRLYTLDINNNTIIALRFNGAGLWGAIQGVLALNSDGTRIIGLDIISHNETPGLGARIDEEWYIQQFSGEQIPPEGLSMISRQGIGDPDPNNGEVDGVTGATRTSEAMIRILNEEIQRLQAIIASR